MERHIAPLALAEIRLSRIVRDGRELAGLSQAALARRAGLSRDRVARLEIGAGGTRLRDVEAVLAALDDAGIVLKPDGRVDLRGAPTWGLALSPGRAATRG